MFDWETIGNVALVVVAALTAFGSALWLSLVLWTFRDMRARSRDFFAQILAAAVVAILNIPGLIVYLILRPRETLAEAYERSLEEEALLQSIEEKPICPGCGRAARDHWQVCPYCHTKLKKVCITCGELLNLGWNICPHCASSQLGYAVSETPNARERAPSRRAARQALREDAGGEDTALYDPGGTYATENYTADYEEDVYQADSYGADDYEAGAPDPFDAELSYTTPDRANRGHARRRTSAHTDAVQFIEDDDF